MIDAEISELLERGCALLVGTVDPDGTPHASRGWGLSILGPARVRVLLDGGDAATIEAAGRVGAPVAVTAADVLTLRSVQLKGRSAGLAEPTPEDERRLAAYVEHLAADIERTDGTSPALVRRLVPSLVAAVELTLDARFDQTPGPGAGAAVAGAA